MNDLDVGAIMRRGMNAEGDRAPTGAALVERILASIEIESERPDTSSESRSLSWMPVLAAASVVALVVALVAVTGNLGGGARRPVGSATSGTTPSRSSAFGPAGVALPAGFRPVDLTFINSEDGWALGSVPCPEGRCTQIARTRDGGTSWLSVPAPQLKLPGNVAISTVLGACNPVVCVSGIRFATSAIGYVFNGWQLLMTVDGGSTWHPQTGGGATVVIADGTAWRVHSGASESCATNCRIRVQSAPIGSTSWRDLPLPAGADTGTGVDVARSGRIAAIEIYGAPTGSGSKQEGSRSASTLLTSADDGATWKVRGEPCPQANGGADSLAPAVAADGSITLLCRARAAGGGQFTITSTDVGDSFRASAPVGPQQGYVTGTASSSVLFMATDELYRSANGGRDWRPVVLGGEAANARTFHIDFQTLTRGHVLVQEQGGVSATIWTTVNGGATWRSHTFR
jgi:hypothetical protein